MDVFIGQSQQSNLTTGTHDNLSPASNVTPVASLYVTSRNNTLDVVNNSIGHGIGVTDGTVDTGIGWGVNSASNPSDCNQVRDTAAVISCVPSSQTPDGLHTHNSFIPGGHRVDRTSNGFANTWYANFMHFADCNAAVKEGVLSTSVDTATNIDPGFAWDFVIVFLNKTSGAQSTASDAEFSIGFYTQADDNQASMIWNSDHASAPAGSNSIHMSTTYAGGRTVTGDGSIIFGVDVSAGAGTSCDLTTRIAGAANSEWVSCLFIGFTGSETVKIASWDTPTSLGTKSITGQGVSPLGVINLMSFATSYDTGTTGSGDAYAISFLTQDAEHCISGADESGQTTSDSESYTTAKAVSLNKGDGTTGFEASFVQMTAGGFDLNYTATDLSNVRKNLSLLIGGDVAGTVPSITSMTGSNSLLNEPLEHGETATINGTNFGASGASVIISPTDDVSDVSAETQTITAQSNTQITITVERGSLNLDTVYYVFVTDSGTDSNVAGYPVTIGPNDTFFYADEALLTFSATYSFVSQTQINATNQSMSLSTSPATISLVADVVAPEDIPDPDIRSGGYGASNNYDAFQQQRKKKLAKIQQLAKELYDLELDP
jgi:hypothetical protein